MISRHSFCKSLELAGKRKQAFSVRGNDHFIPAVSMNEDLKPFCPFHLHRLASTRESCFSIRQLLIIQQASCSSVLFFRIRFQNDRDAFPTLF